jgi:anaerobic magnesium-protoporphyrin IX monomethyl ester cyclase
MEDRSSEVYKNSKSILLVQCPPWDTAMPPLGIAYLASYLKKNGYDSLVSDLNISLYGSVKNDLKYLWEQKNYEYWVDEELFQKSWAQLGEIAKRRVAELLREKEIGYIGLSVSFASIKFANELIKIIKGINDKVKIILGGWGCINDHMRGMFSKELVDVFVVGEAEETLTQVIDAFEGQLSREDVLGAIFNDSRRTVYNPRPVIMELDTLPWPTFSEFDLRRYKHQVLPLLGSRGCIGNCSFCNDWPLSRPYRSRSARNIFDEIKYHVEKNKTGNFSFKDLLCNGNISELNLLCDLIINSGIKINWDSQAISRKEMNYDLLCKLKKSGCETLIYGIESFSDNVLKRMRKLFNREIAEKVLKDTRAAGIRTFINIIVGFPGETEDDFEETIQALSHNRKYINQIGAISVCLVNGGSDLNDRSTDYGLVLDPDPRIRAKKWTSTDGRNDYENRRNRAEKIIKLVSDLGLSHETTTI